MTNDHEHRYSCQEVHCQLVFLCIQCRRLMMHIWRKSDRCCKLTKCSFVLHPNSVDVLELRLQRLPTKRVLLLCFRSIVLMWWGDYTSVANWSSATIVFLFQLIVPIFRLFQVLLWVSPQCFMFQTLPVLPVNQVFLCALSSCSNVWFTTSIASYSLCSILIL